MSVREDSNAAFFVRHAVAILANEIRHRALASAHHRDRLVTQTVAATIACPYAATFGLFQRSASTGSARSLSATRSAGQQVAGEIVLQARLDGLPHVLSNRLIPLRRGEVNMPTRFTRYIDTQLHAALLRGPRGWTR